MKKYLIIAGILLLLFLTSCQKTIDLGKNASFKIEKNVSYGKDRNRKWISIFRKAGQKIKRYLSSFMAAVGVAEEDPSSPVSLLIS